MSDEAIGKAVGLGEGLFSTLIDLLPDYFYVLDFGVRVVYVNQSAADYSDTAPYPEPDGTLSYYRRYDIPFSAIRSPARPC